MCILLLIIFVIAMSIFPLSLIFKFDGDKTDGKNAKNKKKLIVFYITVFATIIVTVVLIVVYMISRQNTVIGDSVEINVSEYNTTIFYNEEKDEYFVIEVSKWDLKNPFKIKIVDYDSAKTIRESSEKIKDSMQKIEGVLNGKWVGKP